LEQDIFSLSFPKDQPDDVPIEKCQCTSFGEAVFVFPGNKKAPYHIVEHFRSFYLSFRPNSTICFAYEDPEFSFKTMFKFDDIISDDGNRMVFEEIIKPGLLPSCVFGKDQSATYEFIIHQ
jgi:hypothetical protein